MALVLAACCVAGAAAQPAKAPTPSVQRAQVEVAFTPGDEVDRLIAERIARAKTSVQVQAYLFTNKRIASALANAVRRGLAVEVIGDAQQYENGGLPVLASLLKAGAAVYLDATLAASHNKVVIVDGASATALVVTGSYNFTQAAQSRNAENIVVLSANRALTDRFVANFERSRARSSRLQ
jgi:phosphatidylserine/phosphatidylglycerophosphate/cardiolipin synthase-like enzyme